MHEKKDWTVYRIILAFSIIELVVICLRIAHIFTFNWWYTLIPLVAMYAVTFTYMSATILAETLKNYIKEKHNSFKYD